VCVMFTENSPWHLPQRNPSRDKNNARLTKVKCKVAVDEKVKGEAVACSCDTWTGLSGMTIHCCVCIDVRACVRACVRAWSLH